MVCPTNQLVIYEFADPWQPFPPIGAKERHAGSPRHVGGLAVDDLLVTPPAPTE